MNKFFENFIIVIATIFAFILSIGFAFILAIGEVLFYSLLVALLLFLGFKFIGVYVIGGIIMTFFNIFKITTVFAFLLKAIIALIKILK